MKELVQPKISTLVKMYLKVHKTIESSTADLTERSCRHLINAIGDLNIKDVSFGNAEEFQAHLIDAGLSKTSANIFVKTISPVFNWAGKRGYLDKNVFTELKKFKITPKQVQTFRPDEIERLLTTADNLWKARILLGLTTLRRGEILNLTIKDIDFERNTIFIQSKQDTAYTWRFEPKDHDRRMLPLIPVLRKRLLTLFEKLPQGQPYLLLKAERYGYLLRHKEQMSDRLKKCPDNNFNRAFRILCRRAFVDGNFHQLRSTGLTLLTNQEARLALQEVRNIAGHSNIETTTRYLGSRPDVLTRAGDILNRGVAQFG